MIVKCMRLSQVIDQTEVGSGGRRRWVGQFQRPVKALRHQGRSRVEPSERGIGQCGSEEELPTVRLQVVGRSLQNVIASRFACDAEAYRTGIAVDAQLRRLGTSCS